MWQEAVSRSRHLVFRMVLHPDKGGVVRVAEGEIPSHEGCGCVAGIGEKLWRRGAQRGARFSALALIP